MVKISFVCPVFNKEKYLNEVLKSINNQKGEFEKEFIFINDGSSDNSLQLLKQKTKTWKNTKIFNQDNFGPSIATQKGISLSKGDYVKLVGGDDILHPNCTNLLLSTIKKNNSVAVFSRYKLTKNLENINFKIERKPLNLKIIKEPTYQTVKSSFSGTSPTLYCTKTLKKSGGCNTKIFVEDFSLALRISKYGNFSFLNNITSFGPSDDKNRIMIGKKTQLIHDYNSALYYFIKENNDLNLKIKILACKKAIGRAEKWGRRIINKSFLNEMNLLKFKFFFNKNNFSNILLQTCKFFYKNSKNDSIRYMIK